MIKLYNTMTRRKEIFKPIQGNRVKLFVCGPTVYDHSHIGHARTYISFDVIARYLKYSGFTVFYIQNITDLDDKILKRADELGSSPIELARRYEEKYLYDMKILGVENVNLYARATEHIPEIIKQIEILIEKGYAYETDKGVYFDESKFEDFGKLSNRNLEDLNVHRIGPDSSKRNPGDFALWKKRKNKSESQEMIWDSPWGTGRPGWHIEDTAITETYFGPQYDIHGGGLDLIFPHHEAEIAQMEAASGKKPMVRYWMHTGFLNVKGEKMSKSLGNFITINELLQEYSSEVFRFFVLSTHYRSPIDFSQEILSQSQKGLQRIYKFIETINEMLDEDTKISMENDVEYIEKLVKVRKEFFDAMDNDFNTPSAFSSVFDLIREVNRDINQSNISKNSLTKLKALIIEFGVILGFDFSVKQNNEEGLEDDLVTLLKDVREKLREKKEWALSDEIRSRLKDLDIVLEDKST
ncbi:cysteine--tRNA ligase [Methanobacterium spitsbergense]|uniref:Cysteine--tRNA ligase n=1 Tax=Methanobacterium spitsbergense TaxID=2874285 RepID=A0A8T5UTR3_9EURY|nr:cysteine--tRNA ligase [Methanobacterium spitsbergense]MBZ2165356.1 cysteine--tRNA ligase [Methanobacterium spitsbergense]